MTTEDLLFSQLNDKQKKAVEAPRQPILMLAGPGTGKTRTLIARIAFQIHHFHIPADHVLALTFSNKAAGEIRNRLEESLKEKAGQVRSSTFHSFCLNILRKYPEQAGLPKHFYVSDDNDQNRILRQLLQTRIRDHVEKKLKGIQLAFSNHILKDKPLPPFSAMIFEEYLKILNKHGMVNYDQILVKTRDLFKQNQDILNQYRFMNQAILVDEFQDTDPVQYEIVKMLAEKHRNIFVVADDDQSIYAWRGANPQNIRQFIKDFSVKETLFLDYNYRCAALIMDAAQSIVSKTERIEPNKKITSNNQNKARVHAIFFEDESQEIQYIIKKITDWQNNHQVDFSAMAVIFPRHKLGENLAAYLLRERIPYQQASGRNLTDHPVMKKVLLYLKLIRDPSDELILEELAESEMGYHIYKQIQDLQKIRNLNFKKALNEMAARNEIGYRVRNQISTFIGNIANLINLKTFFSFDQLIREIITGIRDLKPSLLLFNAPKFQPVTFRFIRSLLNPAVKIWLYHDDPKLQFIGGNMLERAFAKQVHPFSSDKIIHVNANDIVLLLKPFPAETVPGKPVNIYDQISDKRRGILSTLFRWLQVQLRGQPRDIFNNYVVFDLETTGKDPERCGIVELAAVRVEDGKIVDRYQTLINPEQAIEPGAREVHGITDDDVKSAPSLSDVWPKFKTFVGDDLLIAHNGYSFDFKVLDRMARELGLPRLMNNRYDSLILARNLYPGKPNSIDGLMERFQLKASARHRALDDVIVLHDIFQKLLRVMDTRETRTAGEEFCEFVALGNVLENCLTAFEDRIFLMAGLQKLLSPFSAIRRLYSTQFEIEDDALNDNLMRLSQRLNLNAEAYDSDEHFYQRVLELSAEFRKLHVDQAIAEFLSYIALVNPQDSLKGVDAVSLLTFHSAKGLEFDRVILMGMEDDSMPSFFAYKSDDEDDRPVSQKLEEQKRLLYVGMTRGKEEVVFTAVKNRAGRLQKSSPFLEELKDHIEIKFVR